MVVADTAFLKQLRIWVGYESLCVMQYLDPGTFADIFRKIGELYETLWTKMLEEYDDLLSSIAWGDDLGASYGNYARTGYDPSVYFTAA